MSLIPSEEIPHFESVIYFPMIMKALEGDKITIGNGPFKLKGPYLKLINEAFEFV